jgi:hypothetical protein
MFVSVHRFRPATTLEETNFRPDGTRTVTGPLGTIEYDVHGNATFIGSDGPLPRAADHTRWDLAA